MIYGMLWSSPLGIMTMVEENGAITHLDFGESLPEQAIIMQTHLLNEAISQLASYFSGDLQRFSLPLAPVGTDFQMAVWQALQNIPYGEVCSYKDIAQKIGKPKACRAVGGANNRNPIAIIIPCHRVIGAGGALVGYAGGLDKKEKLLALERHYRRR